MYCLRQRALPETATFTLVGVLDVKSVKCRFRGAVRWYAGKFYSVCQSVRNGLQQCALVVQCA